MSPKIVYDVTLPGGDLASPDGVEFRDRAILHCNLLVDYAGNKFEAYSTLSGNDTAIIIRKYSLSDALLGEVTLHPPQGFKLDDFSLFPSDTNVLVLAVAHEAISDPQRRNIGYRDVWPGVFVAYPSGHLPVDAATPLANWTRDIPPDPTPTYTLDQIAAAVVNRIKADMVGELGNLVQQRAKNGSRQAIQTEVATHGALSELSLSTEFIQGLKDGLYQWAKDRNFEGSTAALHDFFPPK